MAVDPATEQKIQERAAKILSDFDGDPLRIAVLAAQFQHFAAGGAARSIEVSGGVSSRDGSPYVHFMFEGDIQFQLPPDEARQHALMILEATEAAVADAAIFKWATTYLKVEREKAAVIIGHIRDFRADRWGGVADDGESTDREET